MLRSASSPEWVAFVHRLKPALRIGGARRRVHAHAHAARQRHFAAEVVELDAPAPYDAIVYIARTPAGARDLRALEDGIRPTRRVREMGADGVARHRALGEALGFPACCIDAFAARLARGVDRMADGSIAHEDFVAVSDAAAASARLDPLLNMFPLGNSSPWLSHVPCRFDCDESRSYAAGVRDTYIASFPASAVEIARDLATDVAITRAGARVTPPNAPPDAVVLAFSNYLDPT